MRSLGVAATSVALILALSGCTAPEPEPSPTPTGFASEEEAFAAAEETYRAYVARANEVDLADPETFEPLYELATGDALSAAKEEFTMMHAEGYVRSGESSIALVEPRRADLDAGLVELDVCIDNSELDVISPTGTSVVSPDRPDIQPMLVSFDVEGTTALISSALLRTDGPPCPSE